jgi:fructose-1,6-bisphosphatase/inositol monophosphatase family enzyme
MPSISINVDKISDIIRDVANDKIVPRFQQLAQSDIRAKSGPTDLVTIADEEAEIEITKILKGLYPSSHVLGEEAVSSGVSVREILNQTQDPVWIVDPVDGTNNFAHGTPIFGTMLCLVQNGERIASWIYQIPKDNMVACEKGAGISMNGQAYTPAQKTKGDADFQTMRAFVSRKFIPPHMRPYVDEQVKKMGDVSTFMCCAWEYVDVLEGRSAFSLYKRIEPWDHMAGVLMLEEAGYYIRKWDKTPYAAHDLSGGLINAPNEELWDRVYDMFLKDHLEQVKRA